MKQDLNHLFVYGSLLEADNEFGIYLRKNSESIGFGVCNGLLFDVAEYPGAFYDPDLKTTITGEVYRYILGIF